MGVSAHEVCSSPRSHLAAQPVAMDTGTSSGPATRPDPWTT